MLGARPRRWLLRVVVGLLLILGFVEATKRMVVPPVSVPAVPVIRYLCPIRNAPAINVSVNWETASCDDCTYYPVDKEHRLPATYRPPVVDTELPGGGMVLPVVKAPLQALFAEARRHRLWPTVTSAYRSFDIQAVTFRNWLYSELRQTGDLLQAAENAAQYSAKAGYSEHQLGTAIDVNCEGCKPFDDQDARNVALWDFLAVNAHLYGFVISYPPGMEARTGYQYEPWHIRYVGVDLATELYDQGYLTGSGACASALLREKALYPVYPTESP